MFLIPALVFLTVVLALLGLALWLEPSRVQQRAQALASPQQGGSWAQLALTWAGPLASLSTPEGHWQGSALRLKMLQAGLRSPHNALYFYGLKTALPLLTAMLTALLLWDSSLTLREQLLVVSTAALGLAYLPDLLLWLLIRARRREILEHFPDALDLLLICIEAGLGLDAAMARVTQELAASGPSLSEELHLSLLEVRAGASREQAMHHLALRTGLKEMASFALMLKQADKLGTRIGHSLRVYSADLRHQRLMRAEEAAAKIPTQLLLPLVLFIFPSIIMVIMGPALIRIIRTTAPLVGSTA